MSYDSVCDLNTLSDLLRLSPRHVQRLANEGVVHKSGRGKYEFARSIKGYIDYLNSLVPNKVNPEDQTDNRALADAARAKLISEKAIIASMDRREKEESLRDASEVKRDAATCAVNVRQAMMVLPDSLSPLLVELNDAREIRSLLRRELTQSLTDVSAAIAVYAAAHDQTADDVIEDLELPAVKSMKDSISVEVTAE